MAVTITERPQGYILGAPIEGESYHNGIGAYQTQTDQEHGLVTGDLFYIITTVDSYNGFFEVGSYNPTQVQNLDIVTGLPIPFIRTSRLLFYPVIKSHNWSCVHLPIVYKAESDFFPYGAPVNTILSFADSSGNTDITPTASLSALFEILGFVRLEGTSVDGIYEIINNSGSLVIDLPYNASNVLAGGTMAVYYPNYHIRVQIYAGLTTTHYWEDKKPYELVSTLKLIPDNNNEIQFSVSKEIKKKIKSLTNNLSLDTLPNNIDAFAMFYITTQEVYDLSDSSEVSTFEDTIVSDKANFEGFAVNAKLPFKNIHSGYLSDYLVDEDSVAAKFLTLFETPVMFDGYYFEIGALLNYNNTIYYDLPDFFIRKTWLDSNGDAQLIRDEQITNYDAGLYRIELTPDCDYSQLSVYIFMRDHYVKILAPNTNWTNAGAPLGYSLGPTTLVCSDAGPSTFYNRRAIQLMNIPADYVITINLQIVITGTWTINGDFTFSTFPALANGSIQDYVTVSDTFVPITANGTYNFTRTMRLTEDMFALAVGHAVTVMTGTANVTITVEVGTTLYISGDVLTETKTMDIACNCNDQGVEGTQLMWLNYLGGFDQWVFTGQTAHQIDIKEARTRMVNIFPTWPTSYGPTANTMRQETSRKACFRKTLRSQNVSIENLQGMQYLKTSSLVQIVESQTDLRTVLVDTDSFQVYQDNDKEFSISFNIEYTDYIPSQDL